MCSLNLNRFNSAHSFLRYSFEGRRSTLLNASIHLNEIKIFRLLQNQTFPRLLEIAGKIDPSLIISARLFHLGRQTHLLKSSQDAIDIPDGQDPPQHFNISEITYSPLQEKFGKDNR